MLALHGVENVQAFQITSKDQNQFYDAKSGLRDPNDVSEIVL